MISALKRVLADLTADGGAPKEIGEDDLRLAAAALLFHVTAIDGVDFALVATAAANSTAYGDAGLVRSTRYYYRVRSYNANGFSAYSNTVSTRTPRK